MVPWILLAGLGLCLGGALSIAVGDAWLSRSLLVYLDAIESNLAKVVEAMQAGESQPAVVSIDLKRDRGQNQARGLKMLGWLSLVLGFGLQIAYVYLTRLAV